PRRNEVRDTDVVAVEVHLGVVAAIRRGGGDEDGGVVAAAIDIQVAVAARPDLDRPGVAGRRGVDVAGLVAGADLEGVRAVRQAAVARGGAAGGGEGAAVEADLEGQVGRRAHVVSAGEREGRGVAVRRVGRRPGDAGRRGGGVD